MAVERAFLLQQLNYLAVGQPQLTLQTHHIPLADAALAVCLLGVIGGIGSPVPASVLDGSFVEVEGVGFEIVL